MVNFRMRTSPEKWILSNPYSSGPNIFEWVDQVKTWVILDGCNCNLEFIMQRSFKNLQGFLMISQDSATFKFYIWGNLQKSFQHHYDLQSFLLTTIRNKKLPNQRVSDSLNEFCLTRCSDVPRWYQSRKTLSWLRITSSVQDCKLHLNSTRYHFLYWIHANNNRNI